LTVDAWGGFSSQGTTELALYEGTLDAHAYQDILQKKLLPAAQGWFEDEGRVGTATRQGVLSHGKVHQRWLEQLGVDVVEGWPTKGDDINPIENLWAILDERLESKKFRTEKGMKKAIRQLWDELDLSLLHNLIHSIQDRLRRIRKAKGGSIQAVK
jgi:transposase